MTNERYDLIIRNGTVVDPSANRNSRADVAIYAGKIIEVGKVGHSGIDEIDASGAFVVPGLIDFHTHIAPLCEIGVPGEAVCFASGVTTAVDCGSAGAAAYRALRGCLAGSRLRILAWLHSCSAGLATGRYPENPNPDFFDVVKIADCMRSCDELIGLKIRQSTEITGNLGLSPLIKTIAIAEELGVPVMVHCTNPPGNLGSILDLMRAGDVVTHMYHGRGSTILEEQEVAEAALRARERGVWFDVGNANIHFAFRVAVPAIRHGFLPDSISTDITTRSMYRRPQVFSLLHVMSKFLNMGLSFDTVLELCTSKPARYLGIENETGTLKPGSCADIAVLMVENRPVIFGDDIGETITGGHYIKNLMTIRTGEIVYRDAFF